MHGDASLTHTFIVFSVRPKYCMIFEKHTVFVWETVHILGIFHILFYIIYCIQPEYTVIFHIAPSQVSSVLGTIAHCLKSEELKCSQINKSIKAFAFSVADFKYNNIGCLISWQLSGGESKSICKSLFVQLKSESPVSSSGAVMTDLLRFQQSLSIWRSWMAVLLTSVQTGTCIFCPTSHFLMVGEMVVGVDRFTKTHACHLKAL